MALTMSMAVTGLDHPAKPIRVFWAVTMGAVAAVLLLVGQGGISALQSFIVITAVPVGLLLLPTLWLGPKVAIQLYNEVHGVETSVKSVGKAAESSV